MNPFVLDELEEPQLKSLKVDLCYSPEWDEFLAFVGRKSNIRWTWYAVERRSGIILAWENARRADKVLEKLLNKVAHLPIRISHTDDWGLMPACFRINTGTSSAKIILGGLNIKI